MRHIHYIALTLVLVSILQKTSLGQATLQLQYEPCNPCIGSNIEYQTNTCFSNANIASDYGARIYNGYDWHNGIDYGGSMGYHLISPVTGTVSYIHGTDFKYIIINGPGNDDFAFGHIFDNTGNQVGDMKLVPYGNPTRYAIVNVTTGPNTHVALGPYDGDTFILPGTTTTYTVTNQVTSGVTIIAPLGNSSGGTTFAPHLHLYRLSNPTATALSQNYNETKDPFERIQHTQTSYTITTTINNLTAQGGSTYYAGNIRSGFQVHCEMINPGIGGAPPNQNYANSSMDIDKVELLIKPEWAQTYSIIQGRNYELKIWEGGQMLNSLRYPSNGNPTGNTYDIGGQICNYGSFLITGIIPSAYDHAPYDDYYLSDFYTRIKALPPGIYTPTYPIGYADINQDAWYPDGRYNWYPRITRATGDQIPTTPPTTPTNTIVIDNFRPYLQQVIIGSNFAKWNWNGSQLSFQPMLNSIVQPENITTALVINLIFSEPMDNVTIDIPGIISGLQPSSLINDNTSWNINIPLSNLIAAPNGTYTIHVNGQDYALNNLEGFDNTNPVAASSIPIRQNSNVWSPAASPSEDNIHSFTIQHAPPIAIFQADETNINEGTHVHFENQSTGNCTSWAWTFAGGTPATSTVQNPTVTYNTPGTYDVSLTVSSAYGSDNETKTQYIHVFDIQSCIADFTASPTSGDAPLNIQFTDISHGGVNGPTSWTWDFDDGTNSTLQYPSHTFNDPGIYHVTLTASCSGATDNITKTISVNDPDSPDNLTINCVLFQFAANVGEYIDISVFISGDHPPYEVSYNFGDGVSYSETTSNINSTVSHAYSSPGTYNVNIAVTDANGEYATCSDYITISGNPCANFFVDFTISENPVNTNTVVVFTDNSTGTLLYDGCEQWLFGPESINNFTCNNSAYDLGYSVLRTFPNPGNYPVQMYAPDNLGCGYAVTKYLTVIDPFECMVPGIGGANPHRVPVGITNTFYSYNYLSWNWGWGTPCYNATSECYWDREMWTIKGPLPSTNTVFSQLHNGYIPHEAFGRTYTSIDYSFQHGGEYKLRKSAWSVESFDQTVGFTCEGTIEETVYAIDCQKTLDYCSLSIPAGNHPTVEAKIITLGGSGCATDVQSGANIIYQAHEEIIMKQGFSVWNGSNFTARIEPCPRQYRAKEKENPTNVSKENLLTVFPNPNNGLFTITLKDNIALILQYNIRDLLGKMVYSSGLVKNNTTSVTINSLASGIYILSVIINTGEYYNIKFIKY